MLYTVNTWHSGGPRRAGVVAYLEVLTYHNRKVSRQCADRYLQCKQGIVPNITGSYKYTQLIQQLVRSLDVRVKNTKPTYVFVRVCRKSEFYQSIWMDRAGFGMAAFFDPSYTEV